MRNKRLAFIVAVLILVTMISACAFQKQADQKFGDQHFKTAISLIELHKVRFGEYPSALRDLKFTGDWDPIALNSVEYKRVGNGYELNLSKGWVAKPDLKYPDEFWKGLGLVKSNLKPSRDAEQLVARERRSNSYA
jgi:hypothetical protein